jgi:hypothetical protein
MNRRIFILTCIWVYLAVALLTGCAATNQIIPAASGPIPSNSARIIVLREGGVAGSAAPIGIIDSGKQIGEVGLHGQLVWDRNAGPMQLVGFHADAPDHRTPPIQMCVGAGMTYRFMASWPALNMHNYPKIELVSGTPVLCEENNADANSGKFQQPEVTAAASAAAQPVKSHTPELSGTFTGDVRIIEVKHFTQSEGLSLSTEFINSFYDGLCEHLKKEQVASRIVDENSAVPDAEAAETLIIEGKFTEYKQGGFLMVGAVSSEIKFYRKSDHALIKIITARVPYKPSPLNTDKIIGKATGGRTVYEIKKALKKE